MKKIVSLFLIILFLFVFAPVNFVQAGTSPTLSALTGYSVLGGAEVTCTGATTTSGSVGVALEHQLLAFPARVPLEAGLNLIMLVL